jgi:hypothetical protein
MQLGRSLGVNDHPQAKQLILQFLASALTLSLDEEMQRKI